MASHTTTSEWKSFEIRMRQRRAERLLMRAAVAAEQGCFDEARTRLEEARRLAPGLPGLHTVERSLSARAGAPRFQFPPIVVRAVSGLQRTRPALVATALLVTVGGGLAVLSHERSVSARDLRQAAPLVDAGDAPPAVHEDDPAATNLAAPPAADLPAPVDARPETMPPPSQPAPDVRQALDTEARVLPAPRANAEPAISPLANPLLAAPVEAAPLRFAAVPASAPLTAPALPAPPVADATVAPPSSVAEDVLVRGTLDRYADAYSSLDAAAARRVWPRVNEAALARAFDDLVSQQVSLGDCRIDIAGATARAACAGSATWAPKVGGGSPRTEARRWTFDLARDGTSWQIVNARVQNK